MAGSVAGGADGCDSRSGPRVVHVSTVHRSTDVRVFGKECRTLAAAGYDVTLYARVDRAGESRAYDEDGVHVVPVPQPASRVIRMTRTVWGLLRPLHARRAAVYHLHDPELIPLGLVLRLLGHTVVYDAHEDLPAQVLEKGWVPRPARPVVVRVSRLLVRLAGRGLSAIVAATPTIARGYRGAARVATVGNFPILLDSDTEVPYEERPRPLAYVGGVARARGLATMLEAARLVHAGDGGHGGHAGGRLSLAGPFQPAALAAELAGTQDAVDYLGVLAPVDARRVMGESRVGLLLYHRSRAHEDSMPNKLFEYMAAGVPVVASDFPLWQEIVAETGAGFVVPPEDAEAVAKAARWLLENPAEAAVMGRRGRRAVRERYSWQTEASTLRALYAALTGTAPGDPAPGRDGG